MRNRSFFINDAKGYGLLGVIAAATFVVHLLFGLYYSTHNADRLMGPDNLGLRDEAYLRAFFTWGLEEESDMAFYNRLALGVMHTGVPRNISGSVSLYAPVYTYFLAACYAVGGVRLYSIAVPQAVMAGLLAWFSGLVAGRLAPRFKPGVMWLAGGLILINLRLAISSSAIVPTNLLLFLFSLVLYLASGPLNTGTVLRLASAVVVAIFAQTAFFVVAFAVALWLAWQFLERKQLALGAGCALILVGIGVMLMLRAAVAGQTQTHQHENTVILWESNNPYYESLKLTGLWGRRPGNPWSQWQPSAEEQERYNDYLARAKASTQNPGLLWIRENPTQYAKLCGIRFYTTLGPITGQMSPRNRLVSTFYWFLLFPAGYYGLWRTRFLSISRMAILVFLVLTAFETLVITEWYLRYRMPWELILTLYAAVGYMHILSGRVSKTESNPPRVKTSISPVKEGDRAEGARA